MKWILKKLNNLFEPLIKKFNEKKLLRLKKNLTFLNERDKDIIGKIIKLEDGEEFVFICYKIDLDNLRLEAILSTSLEEGKEEESVWNLHRLFFNNSGINKFRDNYIKKSRERYEQIS